MSGKLNLICIKTEGYEMLGKLHLICMKTEVFHAKIRCNFSDISYLSETQKNNFQFLYLQLLSLFFLLSFFSTMFSLKLRFQLITFRAFRL